MHPYAVDSDERVKIPLYLAAISFILAWALHQFLTQLSWSVPWWIDAPSIMGFYGLLYTLFDRIFWKSSLVRKTGLVKTPNLKGNWEGTLVSSYDDFKERHRVEVHIEQTWTKIVIIFRTSNSTSQSVMAGFITQIPSEIMLTYEYRNEPRTLAKETMHAHDGTAWLIWKNEKLEGSYYTGRDRKNHGEIELHRVKS